MNTYRLYLKNGRSLNITTDENFHDAFKNIRKDKNGVFQYNMYNLDGMVRASIDFDYVVCIVDAENDIFFPKEDHND